MLYVHACSTGSCKHCALVSYTCKCDVGGQEGREREREGERESKREGGGGKRGMKMREYVPMLTCTIVHVHQFQVQACQSYQVG